MTDCQFLGTEPAEGIAEDLLKRAVTAGAQSKKELFKELLLLERGNTGTRT